MQRQRLPPWAPSAKAEAQALGSCEQDNATITSIASPTFDEARLFILPLSLKPSLSEAQGPQLSTLSNNQIWESDSH